MRDVLRAPGVLGLFLASCVARLPMGALGLLLVLHTEQLTGSYAKGGLASGAYAIALGLSNPALARVVDRRGQTLVLRLGAPLAAAAIVALAMLPDGAALGALLAAADVARDLTGALRGPGVRVLIAVFVLCGLSVGAVEVAVPAALDATGHRELTGVMLGLWGVGSMVAGLAIGRLGAAVDPPRWLAVA